jgi:Immunity protein 53
VDISTIDNPGWSVSIGLHDTAKQEAKFEPVRIDREPEGWIHYWVEEQKFHIHCGPLNLSEAIELFVRWFDSPSR